MRGISASRVQQAHALLQGVRAHAAIIARAIGQALPLLPFDFRRFAATVPGRTSGQAPLTTLPPARLLSGLAEEYVFAELCEAALTAFAAENEARVATMLAAKGNLESMLTGLQALERQIRQEEITAEVVELAGSAGAGA